MVWRCDPEGVREASIDAGLSDGDSLQPAWILGYRVAVQRTANKTTPSTATKSGVFCVLLRADALDQRASIGSKKPPAAHMIASMTNVADASTRCKGAGHA